LNFAAGESSKCTTKQKQILAAHFFDLKQTYIIEGNSAFNKKYNSIKGLGRATKSLLISSFKENS
jgi:hypothetical protein